MYFEKKNIWNVIEHSESTTKKSEGLHWDRWPGCVSIGLEQKESKLNSFHRNITRSFKTIDRVLKPLNNYH